MSVGVETRGVNHELHLLGIALGWEEFDSRFSGASLGRGVSVGVVPVNVTTVDETSDQSNCAIGEGLGSRIPTRLLHLQHIGVFPPTARRIGNELGIGAGTRVKDSNGAGTVVVLVGRVEVTRTTAGVCDGADISTGANGAVSTEGSEGTVGKVHSGGTKGIRVNVHDVCLVGSDVPTRMRIRKDAEIFIAGVKRSPDGTPSRVTIDLWTVALGLVENVHLLFIGKEHLLWSVVRVE